MEAGGRCTCAFITALLLAMSSSCAGSPERPAASTQASPPQIAPPPPPVERPCPDDWFLEAERLSYTDAVAATRFSRRCLRSVSGPPQAWRLLASLEVDDGRPELARRTLLRGVATHPRDAFSWAALGRLEASSGHGSRALGAFERAHRLMPDHDGLAGEHARALARYGGTAARTSSKLAPLFAEADGRAELGDFEGAEGVLLAAELGAGEVPELRAEIALRRGLFALARGEAGRALSSARAGMVALGTGLSRPALRAELWNLEAEARLALGELEAAVLAAREARALLPSHPVAAANLGIALLGLGDDEGAGVALREALRFGIVRRLDRASFMNLDGVQDLSARDAELKRAVEAAFGALPSVNTEAPAP